MIAFVTRARDPVPGDPVQRILFTLTKLAREEYLPS